MNNIELEPIPVPFSVDIIEDVLKFCEVDSKAHKSIRKILRKPERIPRPITEEMSEMIIDMHSGMIKLDEDIERT